MKLICPAENWRHPIEVPAETASLLAEVAGRLGLAYRYDAARGKVYLGRQQAPTPKATDATLDPGRYTPNFHREEFRCGDGTLAHEDQLRMLAQRLETLRTRIGGRQIHITSGYRSPAWNAQVGGEVNSYHTRGMAADIYVDGLSVEDLARAADAAGFDGIGRYYSQGFVHVDIRGYAARWTG